MYQNCCKKCGSISLHTEVKGNNTGLYCDDCGSWIKWLGKDELKAFEYSQNRSQREMTGLEFRNELIKRLNNNANRYIGGTCKGIYYPETELFEVYEIYEIIDRVLDGIPEDNGEV